MSHRLNRILMSAGLSISLLISISAHAENTHYQCSYTHAEFTAPFIQTPGTRNCPETHCKYDILIYGTSGSINGVSGFSVEQNDASITLIRTAKDPIMGGMDTTILTINKTDMVFKATKTTTPSVVLTTKGTCS